MTDRRQSDPSVLEENWDADFDFQQHPGQRDLVPEPLSFPFPFHALAARTSHRDDDHEDWGEDDDDDDDDAARHSSRLPPSHAPPTPFSDWAADPSTPSTKNPHPRRTTTTESWDDDFEDKPPPAPLRKFPLRPLDGNRLSGAHAHAHAHAHDSPHHATRESAFWTPRDEHNVSPTKRPRDHHHAYSDFSSSEDDEDDNDGQELGFTDDKDQDRTITARLRPSRATFSHSPPPPVPSLPPSLLTTHHHHQYHTIASAPSPTTPEPFPRSPTNSSFFSLQQNATASTSHVALRRTLSGASSTLALLPPSPPIHRERRRLRKKSRPPPRLEAPTVPTATVVTAVTSSSSTVPDRTDARPPSPSPPAPAPERSPTPPPPPPPLTPSTPTPTPDRHATPQKVPLMSRIGSVKKWSVAAAAVRKKRDSTAPSEVVDATSTPTPTQRNGSWFSRNAPDNNDAPSSSASASASPGRLGKRRSLAFVKRDTPTKDVSSSSSHQHHLLLVKARRPTSMQSYVKSSSGDAPTPAPAVRAIGSMSVEDLLVHGAGGALQQQQRPPSRNARKVSASRAHKRTQSSGATDLVEVLPVKTTPPPKVLVRPERDAERSTTMTTMTTPRASTCSRVPADNDNNDDDDNDDPKSSATEPFAVDARHGGFVPLGVAAGTLAPNVKALPPQTASLGRATPPVAAASKTLRRNSLSDLKIPTRISEAQVGLRRDLRMVKAFAANVEQLKALEATYASLTEKVQAVIDAPLNACKKPRPRSNTTDTTTTTTPAQRLASALDSIQSRYSVAWECAGLLIELGGGTRTPVSSSPPVSVSEPAMGASYAAEVGKRNRERAITLTGEESKFNPALPSHIGRQQQQHHHHHHASTERHALNRRQLYLLEEILKSEERSLPPPQQQQQPVLDEAPNREWKWGDAMSSTVTLPSEGGGAGGSSSNQGTKKKRSYHRLRMSGLRNVLRSLKRHHSGEPPMPVPEPVVGVCQHQEQPLNQQQRQRAKTTTADTLPPPPTLRMPPPQPVSVIKRETSIKQPRRPSLASIFRLGQRYKTSSVGSSVDNVQSSSIATESSGRDSCSITDEGDWDRIESVSDLDANVVVETVRRGRSPQRVSAGVGAVRLPVPLGSRHSSKSQLSLVPLPVDVEGANGQAVGRPRSRTAVLLRDYSVRQPTAGAEPATTTTSPKLAMTPENIRPLLENSTEVISRLERCIAEMRVLVEADVL